MTDAWLHTKQFKDTNLGIQFSYPASWADPEVFIPDSTDKYDTQTWSVYFGPDCGNDCRQKPNNSEKPFRSGVLSKTTSDDFEYELSSLNVISDTSKNGIRTVETEFRGVQPPWKSYSFIINNSVYGFGPQEPYFQKEDIDNFIKTLKFL